jgi:hypothetical protein
VCYAACPQVGLNDGFVGPAALALAHRYNLDSRDGGSANRGRNRGKFAFEAEHGKVTHVRKIRRQVPVQEYLKLQRRFAHLFKGGHEDPCIARLQAICDANIAEYGLGDATGRDG